MVNDKAEREPREDSSGGFEQATSAERKAVAKRAVQAAEPEEKKEVAAAAVDALSAEQCKELIQGMLLSESGHCLAIYLTGFIVAGAVALDRGLSSAEG